MEVFIAAGVWMSFDGPNNFKHLEQKGSENWKMYYVQCVREGKGINFTY